MYRKDELIVYGNTGVCRISDICTLKDDADGRLYYKLTPVFEKCDITIPVNTKVFIRPVISKEEALDLISKLPHLKITLPEVQNSRQLKDYYKTAFTFNTCEGLSMLIKTIYAKINSQTASGKKPCQTDLQYIKKAEELLYGELSVALDIPYDEVPGFIEKTISNLEADEICQCS